MIALFCIHPLLPKATLVSCARKDVLVPPTFSVPPVPAWAEAPMKTSPATENKAAGLVVPNPTLELVVSKLSMGMAVDEEVAMEKALTPVGMVVVEDEA